MKKTLATELKVGEVVNFTPPSIPKIFNSWKLNGIIDLVRTTVVGGVEYIYINVKELDGQTKYAYLRKTEEILTEVISDEEKIKRFAAMKIRNLTRTTGCQGSDPEMFVVNKDNQVIPAFDFLGSKEKPNTIKNGNSPLFWDGFQAEFNVPAVSCLDSTVYYLWQGLKVLQTQAQAHDKDARLTITPTMDILPHLLSTGKEEHVAFGCMPSKNVYDMKGLVKDGRDVPFRSAGGHIHLELYSNQKKKIPEYVKALDSILGVACVSLFGSFDDVRRREYYGLAGEYRTPSHGLEYRTLSNVWLCHPTVTYIVFELARKIISLVDSDLYKHWKASEADTIAAINDCNIPLACEILKQNEEMFKNLLHSFCYKDQKTVDVVYATFMTGVENLIPKVDNIAGNWKLEESDATTSQFQIRKMSNLPTFKKLLETKV